MSEVYLPAIANIAALRTATTSTLVESQCIVLGYYAATDGGEGVFVSGASGTDNSGTIINDASGRSWYREEQGQPISVKWFGAKGDGSNDDTSAINNALSAYPTTSGKGYSVYFPAGSYLISSTLQVHNNPLALQGGNPAGGMTLLGAGLGISVIVHNLTNVTFVQCTVSSGNLKFNLRVQGLTFYAENSGFDVFHVITQNVCNQVFEDCQFWSVNASVGATSGLEVTGVQPTQPPPPDPFYAYVKNCVFEGASISIDNVTDSWISNCVIFAENGLNTGCRPYGIQITGNATDIKIDLNHIQAAMDGGIFISSTTSSCTAIRDNFFDTNSLTSSAVAINISTAQVGVVISGNCFSGIPAYAIDATDLSYSTINGNVFSYCGNTSGEGYPTILFSKSSSGCVGNVVSGNTFYQPNALSPTVAAIYENAGSSGANIYGPNSVAGVGYSSQAVTFDATSGDSMLLPWTGMTTKSGGTVTIASGTTSVTANHNLAYTPSREDFSLTNITGWGSASKVWISSVTATQFTVSVDANPGTSIIFGYRVEYRGNFSDS